MTWLYLPSTCLPSAPESEASNLASELPNPERVASLTWRGKPRRPQLWSRAWRKAGYIRLLSGLILSPSTLNHGVASYIASLQATPANQTPWPANDADETTTDGSSIASSPSSKPFGRIVSSVKTSRGTRTDSLKPSSRHWSGWVTALRREYSARSKSAALIDENDFSSWPTASVMNAHGNTYTRDHGQKGAERLSLVGEAQTWSTPQARLGDGRGAQAKRFRDPARKGGSNLDDQVAAQWPSPVATDGKRGRDMVRRDTGKPNSDLPTAISQWPTPLVADDGNKVSSGNKRRQLIQVVRTWPTPAARDFRSPNSAESQEKRNADSARGQQLMNFIADEMRSTASPFSLQVQETPDGPTSSPERRTLNPRFVEWLMGWPIGWTSLEPVATECSRWLLRMRGALSMLVSAQAMAPDRQPQLEMFA